MMDNEEKLQERVLMKSISIPKVSYSSCLKLSARAREYVLKKVQYNLLPSFSGLPSDDPLYFMRDFCGVIALFPLRGLEESELKMKCFPLTLRDSARAWFLSLPPHSLTTWDELFDKFMGKYYHPQRTTQLRRMITNFAQEEVEPFHEAWERFRMLLVDCPHHHFPLELLMLFFYDGLTPQAQELVDIVAGGSIGCKTAQEAYDLFEILEKTSRHKSGRVERRLEVQRWNPPIVEVKSDCGNFSNANVCSMSCEFDVGQYEQVHSQDYALPKSPNPHIALPFQAGREAAHCQIQQQFFNEPTYQQDFYSPFQQNDYQSYQPQSYSQFQPDSTQTSHPSFHSDSFQNPYPINQSYLPEDCPIFFQSQDSFQNFQYPTYGDSFSQTQNQEQPFDLQPPAFTEFQQGGQQYYEHQPLPSLEEQIATSLGALKPETEWLTKLEKEVEEFSSVLQRAGFPWKSSESEVENVRQEEEEKPILVEEKMEVEEREVEAEEKFREQEESGYVGVDLHLNASGLLQQEEEKEGQDNEFKEEEEKMEDEYSYPMIRIGDTLFASSTCQGTLFLRLVNDNDVEGGGVEQDRAELESSTLQPEVEKESKQEGVEEERKLLPLLLARKKEGEKEKLLDEDDYFSLLFRKEEEAKALGFHQKKRRKKRRKKRKKLEEVQYTLLKVNEEATIEEGISSDLDFLIQEVQSLFQHGFSFKREGEKEESLQISPYSPHLHKIKEKESTSTNDFSLSNFLLHEAHSITAGQTTAQLLEVVEEVATMEELSRHELEFLPLQSALHEQQQVEKEREMQKLAAQWELLVEEEEAELELLLQASQSKHEQELAREEKKKQLEASNFTLLEEDFTSADFDFLLLEKTPIKSGQHQCIEKQEDQKSSAPCLQEKEDEAAELHLPQATTPRQKEAAEYPFNFSSFSSEFKLTLNHFLLSLKLFISGDRLQEQQLPLQVICKLQQLDKSGDVHKKGTKGDEVPWFIKVHPP